MSVPPVAPSVHKSFSRMQSAGTPAATAAAAQAPPLERPLLAEALAEENRTPPFCWCCPLDRLLCWHGHSLQLRALDWISQVLFWHSGMYHGSQFQRHRWERVNSLNVSATGIDSSTGAVSHDARVKGAHGVDIPVRIYEGAVDRPKLPVFVYIHGGGFVIGSPEMTNFHVLCNKIAALGFVVVSVNYRLAPEHPFPAAIEVRLFVQWLCERDAQA